MNTEALKLLVKDSKKTKRLDLSHQNMDEVPEEVVNAHHLEKLVLSYNNLKEIPHKLIQSKSVEIKLKLSIFYLRFSMISNKIINYTKILIIIYTNSLFRFLCQFSSDNLNNF